MKKSTNDTETFDLPYDYDSIMHYPNDAFAKTGTNATILSKVWAMLRYQMAFLFCAHCLYYWMFTFTERPFEENGPIRQANIRWFGENSPNVSLYLTKIHPFETMKSRLF